MESRHITNTHSKIGVVEGGGVGEEESRSRGGGEEGGRRRGGSEEKKTEIYPRVGFIEIASK